MSADRRRLVAEIEDDARRLEASPEAPQGYLRKVRSAAARLAAGEASSDDLRHAVLLVEHQADVSADVPTSSRLPPVRLLKATVKRLTMWYLRFLAHQVTLLGHAVARLGLAFTERVEHLEARLDERTAALEDELTSLRQRVDDLERARRP